MIIFGENRQSCLPPLSIENGSVNFFSLCISRHVDPCLCLSLKQTVWKDSIIGKDLHITSRPKLTDAFLKSTKFIQRDFFSFIWPLNEWWCTWRLIDSLVTFWCSRSLAVLSWSLVLVGFFSFGGAGGDHSEDLDKLRSIIMNRNMETPFNESQRSNWGGPVWRRGSYAALNPQLTRSRIKQGSPWSGIVSSWYYRFLTHMSLALSRGKGTLLCLPHRLRYNEYRAIRSEKSCQNAHVKRLVGCCIVCYSRSWGGYRMQWPGGREEGRGNGWYTIGEPTFVWGY